MKKENKFLHFPKTKLDAGKGASPAFSTLVRTFRTKITLHSSSDYNYTIYIFFLYSHSSPLHWCSIWHCTIWSHWYKVWVYPKRKVLLDRYLKLAGITTSFKASKFMTLPSMVLSCDLSSFFLIVNPSPISAFFVSNNAVLLGY